MKVDRKQLCLYAVTDRRWLGNSTLAQQVELALEGGVTFLQLREKDAGPQEILEQARQLLPICRRFGVPLIMWSWHWPAARMEFIWGRGIWTRARPGGCWGLTGSSAFQPTILRKPDWPWKGERTIWERERCSTLAPKQTQGLSPDKLWRRFAVR